MGAGFVWLHLRGSDLSPAEGAQRGRPGCGRHTEAAAQVAPGIIAGPIVAGFGVSTPTTPHPLLPAHVFPLSEALGDAVSIYHTC